MTYIRQNERGLLYRKGDFVRFLGPGRHWTTRFSELELEVQDVREPLKIVSNGNLYKQDAKLMAELELVDLGDGEIALHFVDGRFKAVLEAGLYGFWQGEVKHEVRKFDLTRPETGAEIETALTLNPLVDGRLATFRVAENHKSLLFFDGVFQRLLEPGVYRFLRGPIVVSVLPVEMSRRQSAVTGQELMTKDRVTLRLNFMIHFRIVDPVKAALEVQNYEEQVYTLTQLALREYTGSLTLDEMLERKEDVNEFVLERLKTGGNQLGMEFLFAGLKDIILPGEIKDIMNTVLVAEKKAQANIITRREETASTRSLMNTARLMDENPTLYRLKELEFLERVAEKIGNISLTGGGGLLEHLSGVIEKTSPKS